MRAFALIATLIATAPASAQCFGPGWWCGPRVHFGGWVGPVLPPPPVWGFGYGYGYSAVYVNPWVLAPPVMAVPLRPTPAVFEFADEVPLSGGVDLAALRQKLAGEREDEQRAKARVDKAVKSGEFVVFEPGKALPNQKRAEPPPAKIPDSPKVVDPAAVARLHLTRGQAALEAGELGRATERFAAAVAADSKLGEAHFQLAQVRVTRGQYAEAVDAIRAGMKNVPGWADARFRPDDLYLTQPKRLVADIADLKAAFDTAPTDSTLAFLYAHHLWFGGDKKTAGELFHNLADKVKDQELISPFVK